MKKPRKRTKVIRIRYQLDTKALERAVALAVKLEDTLNRIKGNTAKVDVKRITKKAA